jgi:alpha-galactosidase
MQMRSGSYRFGIFVFLGIGVFAGGCAVMSSKKSPTLPFAQATTLPFEKILPGSVTDYEAMRMSSKWGKEYIIEISRLNPDGLTMECTKGRSGAGHKPWLMLRNVKTQKGAAISLAYSGNWRMQVLPAGQNTLLRAATLPESLETFETVNGLPIPGALVAEFAGDWDNGAQPITRFIRANLLRRLDNNWPWVQYNTWYDKFENIEQERLIESARVAAEIGCELFVIDAGWYGQDPNWRKCVGDWTVNKSRFPNGIEPVADEVRKLGMKFGMWVEIECANPQSPVGQEHPDWFLRDGNVLASKRACLDFGKPEALEWAKGQIDRIVDAYKLDYIKMDFNTDLIIDSRKYDDRTDPLFNHYRALVQLWKYMRLKYPNLIIENCSSGSLRHDLLTAAHTDTGWVSDAVSNKDNLAMNFAATYMFPPENCNHWTCFPEAAQFMDVSSCFAVSMLGQMGISGPIVEWSPEVRQIAAKQIKLYKQIRKLLRNADVYHLTGQADPQEPKTIEAVQYLEPKTDQSIVFVFRGGAPNPTADIGLRGLKAEAAYGVSTLPDRVSSRMVKGRQLMDNLKIDFQHNGEAVILHVEAINSGSLIKGQ